MTYEEALAWLRGERSMTNLYVSRHDQSEAPLVAQDDAAKTMQAYWVVRAHREGLVTP